VTRPSRCSMRHKFGALDRRTVPTTSYPFSRSSSARYDPSCPVIPVMIARFAIQDLGILLASSAHGQGKEYNRSRMSESRDALDALYRGFEDRFRGSIKDVRAKQRVHVPVFAGASDVVDVGCGRGEFLALLKEARVSARGVDTNREMIAAARTRGLDAVEADALDYLQSLPDASIGGLMASQVIEHLQPSYVIKLIATAFDKLRPDAPIVLETINPGCWLAFFSSYLRDFTHVWPVHPETLQYLMQASGFSRVEIKYTEQAPDAVRMRVVDPALLTGSDTATASALKTLADAYNANASILNSLLFTYMDYSAIGYR
jgi:SAM-dependent methyltransferase